MEDSGGEGWLLKQTPELRREKEARRGAGQVSAFHIWIFRMTHLGPGKLLFLTDRKLCSQGRLSCQVGRDQRIIMTASWHVKGAVKCGVILTSGG